MARLLVVEDDATLLEMVQLTFQMARFEVATAVDGHGALDKVASFRPDVVLTDMRMPVCDGLDFCLQLRAAPETEAIPVLIYTAATSGEARLRQALELPRVSVIHKPVSLSLLVAEV